MVNISGKFSYNKFASFASGVCGSGKGYRITFIGNNARILKLIPVNNDLSLLATLLTEMITVIGLIVASAAYDIAGIALVVSVCINTGLGNDYITNRELACGKSIISAELCHKISRGAVHISRINVSILTVRLLDVKRDSIIDAVNDNLHISHIVFVRHLSITCRQINRVTSTGMSVISKLIGNASLSTVALRGHHVKHLRITRSGRILRPICYLVYVPANGIGLRIKFKTYISVNTARSSGNGYICTVLGYSISSIILGRACRNRSAVHTVEVYDHTNGLTTVLAKMVIILCAVYVLTHRQSAIVTCVVLIFVYFFMYVKATLITQSVIVFVVVFFIDLTRGIAVTYMPRLFVIRASSNGCS